MHLFFTRGMSKLYIFLALYQRTRGCSLMKSFMFCYFVTSCHLKTIQFTFCVLCVDSVLFAQWCVVVHLRNFYLTVNGCVQNALLTNSFSYLFLIFWSRVIVKKTTQGISLSKYQMFEAELKQYSNHAFYTFSGFKTKGERELNEKNESNDLL